MEGYHAKWVVREAPNLNFFRPLTSTCEPAHGDTVTEGIARIML